MEKVQVHLRLPSDLVQLIDKMARSATRTRANMIEWMLVEVSKDFNELAKQEDD